MSKTTAVFVVLGVFVWKYASCCAAVIYNNDFEGEIGAEWSKPSATVSPAEQRGFLGEFGAEEVSLSLGPLPTGRVDVAFDLFVIGSWDGVHPRDGDDIFALSANGENLWETTFSNVDTRQFSRYVQNYPSQLGGTTSPSKTGAVEVDTLGYAGLGSDWGDSVYRHALGFSHEAGPLELSFSASLVFPSPGSAQEERWGLDNLLVRHFDPLRGDFNGDGACTVEDLDLLTVAARSSSSDLTFDVSADGFVNAFDRAEWITGIKDTYYGDANLDGQFDEADLVLTFVAGEYNDNIPGNSTWAEGDFGGDLEFDSDDIVLAFESGGYLKGPRRTIIPVPENESLRMTSLLLGILVAFTVRNSQ